MFLPACNTIQNFLYNNGYTKRSDVENQIKSLEEKHKKEVSEKVKDVQTKLEKTIESQDNQLQEGANKLYGANEAFKFYKNPVALTDDEMFQGNGCLMRLAPVPMMFWNDTERAGAESG